jgi:hypothetical protein
MRQATPPRRPEVRLQRPRLVRRLAERLAEAAGGTRTTAALRDTTTTPSRSRRIGQDVLPSGERMAERGTTCGEPESRQPGWIRQIVVASSRKAEGQTGPVPRQIPWRGMV